MFNFNSLKKFELMQSGWLSTLKYGDSVKVVHFKQKNHSLPGVTTQCYVERFTETQIVLSNGLKAWKASGQLVSGKSGTEQYIKIFHPDCDTERYNYLTNLIQDIKLNVNFENLSVTQLEKITNILNGENVQTRNDLVYGNKQSWEENI